MKKRILILNHNQEGFGTYWRCKNIGFQLARLGCDVRMICASGAPFDLKIRRKTVSDGFTIITLPRIKYHRYFTGQLLRMLLSVFIVLFWNYDVCYAFTVAQPQVGLPAWLAKKIKKKHLVVDWDDMWGGGFADMHGSVIRRVLTFCESFFVKYADSVTFVSEMIGHRIEDVVSATVPKHKIANGASVETIPVMEQKEARQFLGLDGDRKYIVSIGNTYTESMGLMFKAFEDVRRDTANVFLLMVGNCEITDKYRSIFDSIKESVLMEGTQPFARVPYYLAAADCLLLPMEDNPIEHARFPMRLGDYLCAQRPIVSNAVGEVKSYLERHNAGLTSPPGDSRSLASNIVKVLNNRAFSHSMALNARRLAENELNWDSIGERILKEVLLKL